ncbi:hypothetical protein [Rhodospira trueperi]|uniref:Uncharacterized protein n=1 Tax=Rhodospira trueperi TaxID=69960 RepID=A0A1G7D2J4_9PROT|nr:hypothetical protein [Rhodospira trueperi]SDE45713.1 hypothetical protein SAMN05421720_1074 [Rhodospira trueperi]
MTTAQHHDGDLMVARASGTAPGTPLPPALAGVPLERLRYDAAADTVIDIAGVEREWHVDPQGRPRLAPADGRQPLTCAGDDPLIRDADTGLWRVETDADRRAAAQTAAAAEIDRRAEAVRLTYLTGGAAQAMTYQRKEQRAREAQAILDAGDMPATGDFPMLAAEVGITAPNLPGVVAVILTQADAWEGVAGRIEAARLSGKAAIAAAPDVPAVHTARDSALAALAALHATP